MSESNTKKQRRKGAWEEIERFQDPDSKVTLILSERIRGRPAYSVQFVYMDDLGPNKHIPDHPPGAKYSLGDIVRSLANAADEFIANREKKSS
jgi:hypothetical protein